jgi:hypothetical protein
MVVEDHLHSSSDVQEVVSSTIPICTGLSTKQCEHSTLHYIIFLNAP